MAQLVEHILGKDEVPGPNPGSSSRHPRGIASGLWFYIELLKGTELFFFRFFGGVLWMLLVRFGRASPNTRVLTAALIFILSFSIFHFQLSTKKLPLGSFFYVSFFSFSVSVLNNSGNKTRLDAT